MNITDIAEQESLKISAVFLTLFFNPRQTPMDTDRISSYQTILSDKDKSYLKGAIFEKVRKKMYLSSDLF
jgi:hypothetical protein